MVGRTLGHYRIVSELGKGGMGEVYRARDEVLGREVAIKVLPEGLTQDAERLARFEREAKVLAAVNHPHIASIYGLEEDDGQRFLVLELVEGETLAGHLVAHPVPAEEAVAMAIQIARALEAAHEKGIVHRDLKPANIKLTPDGDVKVLDFGLAKPSEATFQGDLSESPTLTFAPTGKGVLMGTAAYMSPEQVRGQEVDKRSDIWAFGVVLWEMLTGGKLFGGETVSDVLASTLQREPDWEGLPPDLHPAIRRVLKRCLVQDPRQRLHDIADARLELEAALAEPAEEAVAAPAPAPLWQRALPWLAVPLALLAGWLLKPTPEPEPQPVVRFEIPLPEGERVVHGFRHGVALSADGRRLAFVAGKFTNEARTSSESRILVRSLDQWQSRPIDQSRDGHQPIFSPDGERLAFVTAEPPQLLTISVNGRDRQTLCECDAQFGASWGPDDTIVFAGQSGPLQRISASGGEPVPLTQLREGEATHRLPHHVPDGTAVIFTVIYNYRDWDGSQIVAYSLESGERTILVQGGSDGQFFSSGHLVYAREGKLYALRFDPTRLETSGQEIPVLEGINHSVYSMNSLFRTGVANFAVSQSGTAAYLEGSVFPEVPMSFVFVDSQGEVREVPGLEKKQYLSGRVSPDGRKLLLSTHYKPDSVWTFDLDRATLTRETFEGRQGWAIWGPGPDELTFDSYDGGEWSVIAKQSGSGPGLGRVLYSGHEEVRVGSWSPDGRSLLVVTFEERHNSSSADISILNAEGVLAPFVASDFLETFPDFSPDGRWVTYASAESGRGEVYVRPFPGPGQVVQISTKGGLASAWSRDGREIFYRAEDGQFMAVEVDGSGERFEAGAQRVLFADIYGYAGPVRSYDVAPDGRFLFKTWPNPADYGESVDEFFPSRIQMVENWAEELRAKFPEEH